jgi:hypothetical protein
MIGRFFSPIGCLLLAAVVCGHSEATIPAVISPQQASASMQQVNSPEMDALVAKLAEKILRDKVTSAVVVGGAGPKNKVSEFGVSLRDGLNDALARLVPGIHVFGTAELRAIVTQNRVFGGMIYSNAMKDWIASRAHVDAEITIQIDQVKNGRAWVTLQLFAGPNITRADKLSKANVPDTKIAGQLTLTKKQVESVGREYNAQISIPAAIAGKDGISMPKCMYCPKPELKPRYGRIDFNGTIYLLATVMPDGTVDEIMILHPSGLLLDELSINTVLTWKFDPAIDGQKRPVAAQVPIEIAFRVK